MTKSWGSRLRRWLLLFIIAWLVLTIVPVVLLRWMPPLTERIHAGGPAVDVDFRRRNGCAGFCEPEFRLQIRVSPE